MNINQEYLDELILVLTISINERDYKDKVEETLRNYRKKAQLRGFRKGQVPYAIIRKQYYKILVNNQVKQLTEQVVNDYIAKEHLQIIGPPLPIEQDVINVEDKEFSFTFEIGLAPKFNINLDDINIDYYHIKVEQNDIDEHIEYLQHYFGEFFPREFVVTQEDHVYGTISPFISLDSSKEDKVKNHTLFLRDLSKDTFTKFLQAKVGDRIEVNTFELFPIEKQWRHFTRSINTEHFKTYFIIDQIFGTQPASLNKTLFNKVFAPGLVESIEEFYDKIKKNISQAYSIEADKFFMHLIFDQLFNQTKFRLPSDFLQRSMRQGQKEKISSYQFLKDYEQVEKGVRYQLLKNKLGEQLDISINTKELEDFTLSLINIKKGENTIDKTTSSKLFNEITQDREESLKIYERLFQKRLIEALKLRLSLKDKDISRVDFLKILTQHKH